ncbi:phage terminase large subunit [Veillonella montpellierensis]|uniref:phage terminase large subunit n=1 Tax=Veillonella montpellierensis TaxID=187328 RepID=UPI0023F9403F|nr:phage terminase large subunit [Veillonella montpellierensis]
MNKDAIKYQARLELARRDFFYFCSIMAADFYKKDRHYLVNLCHELQRFYEDKTAKVLIMNMPPRHGKSRSAQMLVKWILGTHPHEKIMTGSYNTTLSTTFAKNVRNDIQMIKADKDIIVYSDIFPNTRIKRGDGSMDMWSLEGGYNSYLATSPSGTATGFGASILILDDIIKNAEEAYNENVKIKHWDWFTNTMLSRLEEGGKIIIIMTRWASDDLAGRAIEHFGEQAKVITMKALQDDGTMLCDEILSLESYRDKVSAMGEDIASANYQQIPIDLKGCLYSGFKTYDTTPQFEMIKSYTDTADQGADYLCSITYGVYKNEAYLLDVIYTKESMEVTEPLVAKTIYDYNVVIADIESNNGGRGFVRSVRRILEQEYNSNRTKLVAFHQSKNKESRILSQATWVMDHIYMPTDWQVRWKDFAKAILRYQRDGKNDNDDGPDTLTGVAEKINAPILRSGRVNLY